MRGKSRKWPGRVEAEEWVQRHIVCWEHGDKVTTSEWRGLWKADDFLSVEM